MFAVTLAFFLHIGDSGIVKDDDGFSVDGCLQVLFAEGFSLFVEVGNVEFVLHPQLVPDVLLLITGTAVFLAEQFTDSSNFACRELISSHFSVCLML